MDNWKAELQTEIDTIMAGKELLRVRTRAVCEVIARVLGQQGKLQNGYLDHRSGKVMWKYESYPSQVYFTATGSTEPLPLYKVCLSIGILPTDRLRNAVIEYFQAATPRMNERKN